MLSTINSRIKENLKNGNKKEANILKLIKSELLNNEKEHKPRQELDVVKSYYKRLDKSLDAYNKYPEKLNNIKEEMNIVKTLLPEMPSENKVRDHVLVTIQNIKTQGSNLSPGPIIGSIKKQLPNAEGKLVARIVKECLDQ